MNIALPALVILLGLLPGIAWFYGYFAGRFDKKRAGFSGVEEFGIFVVAAIPLDAAAYWFCRRINIEFDLPMALHLLSGSLPDPAIDHISTSLREHVLLTCGIYVVILGLSFVLGSVCRRIIWALRIDTYFRFMSFRHPWYYLLHGRYKHLPRRVIAFVDILVSLPEQKDEGPSRLYRGVVIDFDVSDDGKLESVVLRNATRGKKRGPDFEWISIPGDSFTVMGGTIHSINVTYWDVDESEGGDPPAKKPLWKLLARSFWFQDP